MDIATLAAWGEFLGGIAVVASLVYLASQIRQNSKLLRASTASVSNETNSRMSILAVQDPEVARIFWDGMADRNALSMADRRRFDPLISLFVGGVNQEHQFAQDGVIAPSIWEARTRGTRWQFQQPGMQQWWSEWRGIYDDDFVKFMDGLIREGEAVD
jgi:hypothetical protein